MYCSVMGLVATRTVPADGRGEQRGGGGNDAGGGHRRDGDAVVAARRPAACPQASLNDAQHQVGDEIDAQGYSIAADGSLALPPGACPAMSVPSELVPHCPVCGRSMAMNLRADDTFVEDEGWHAAALRYQDFSRRHQRGRVLYLELGVGWNTPVIVKFPFWQAVEQNPRATYACVNLGEAVAPAAIERRSVLIDGDIAATLRALARARA